MKTAFFSTWRASALGQLVLSVGTLLLSSPTIRAASPTLQDRISCSAVLIPRRLEWVGSVAPSDAESDALWTALSSFQNKQWQTGLPAVEGFIATYPQSAWTPSLRSQLAACYYKEGRYSLALQHWEAAWQATRQFKDGPGKRTADFALAYRARLLASLGRYDTLVTLIAENSDRVLDRGPLSQKWSLTREAVSWMHAFPGNSYRCGTLALYHAAEQLNLGQQALPALSVSSPSTGFSIKALSDLSSNLGLGFVPVKREAGQAIVLPSVVHWKENHYAAIVSQSGQWYHLIDPTFGNDRWMTADTINSEASGYFLVRSESVPQGFRVVTDIEAETVFGKGFQLAFTDGNDIPYCPIDSDGGDSPPGLDGTEGKDGSPGPVAESAASLGGGCGSCGGSQVGMPDWRISEPYTSIWLHDEPLGYQPAIGSRVSLKLAYKQRQETDVSNMGSLGSHWACSWLSYIDASFYFRYGVFSQFNLYTSQGGQFAYNGQTLDTNYYTNLRMSCQTNSSGVLTNIQVLYANGAIDNYGLAPTNSNGGQGYVYLTQKASPEGYITTLNYDCSNPIAVNLTNVVDANGGSTTLTYITNVDNTVLLSQVTDPFGRSATFSYDATSDLLTNITDVAGLSSSMIYDSIGVVTNFTTPYGTTSLAYSDAGLTNSGDVDRISVITQPDGGSQMYAFLAGAPSFEPTSYSTAQMPTNDTINTLDSTPNGLFSYHWDPRQYAELSTNNVTYMTTADYLRARMRHWLGLGAHGGTLIDTLSIERGPSPDGTTFGQVTWYDYFGKAANPLQGYYILPDYIGRVLSDGSSFSQFSQRDTWRLPTNVVSSYTMGNGAVGLRTNTYVYSSNDLDLIGHYGPDGAALEKYGYNSNHQLTGFTNAVGDWMTNGYNANSQLSQSRSLTGLATLYNYFTGGSSVNWLQQSADIEIGRTNSYTYYNNGLVQTHTDERGLTVTNTWDNLQRMLTVSDGRGTNSYTYRNLDVIKIVDPLNCATGFAYDSMRRRVAVTNALGRYTLYSYCNCGALNSTRDAGGNTNSFYYDSAGRLTSTVYPDGFSITNNYNLLNQVTNTIDSSGSSLTNWFNNQGLLVAVSNAFGLVKSQMFDFYDRATNVVDANGVAVIINFDNLGRTVSRSYPDTGSEGFGYVAAGLSVYTNQLHFTNFFGYDPAGRKVCETNANWETSQFQYNAAGDLTNLVDGAGHKTAWSFDIYGRVTNKVDHLGNTLFGYSYDADNRLTNRWTPSKLGTTYVYDPVGNLTNVLYHINAPLVMSYDVLNRLTNLVDGIGTTHYGYDAVGQLLNEGGLWPDDTVSFTYNNRLRTGLKLLQPDSSAWTESYGYDRARRLTNVSSPAGSFSYSYDATRHQQVNKLTEPNGAYITNTFDSVARLLSTTLNNSGNTALNSHGYAYNLGNQRTGMTNLPGDYRVYTYDTVGQLKTAVGSEPGGSPARLQEQLGYAYDGADNLQYRTNNSPFFETFSVNTLNELSTITHSGTLTVAGTTTTNATSVAVNSSVVANLYKDATFAASGFTVVNGNNTFTAGAQDALGRTDTNSITVNLPATVTCAYDLNGNLTSDGTRGFDYDDENQLIRVTVTNSWKTEFAYDGKMRRRFRSECTWNGSTWLTNTVTRYVYDANLVIEERDTNNLPAVKYTRGNDLSGTLQGAGGIGGLLARTDMGLLIAGSPAAHSYYHADANGNITAMINTNQAIVAKYLYDPFGNILSQNGSLADGNPYRFSSKEFHKNSGLFYYLYRYYEPTFQRWLNRDPLGDEGFLTCNESPLVPEIDIGELVSQNLYTFVRNEPIDGNDLVGLIAPKWPRQNKPLGPEHNAACTTTGAGGRKITVTAIYNGTRATNQEGQKCCNLAGQVYHRAIENPVFAPFATMMMQRAFQNCLQAACKINPGPIPPPGLGPFNGRR